jgi:NitT/TauT family transport system permease protein
MPTNPSSDLTDLARQEALVPSTRRTGPIQRFLGLPFVPPVVTVGSILVIWQVAVIVREIPHYILPRPTLVVERALADMSLLMVHTRWTLREILAGFALAAVVGVLTGALMVAVPFIDRAMYPILVTVQAVPKIAIAPILVIWFGFGLLPKILTAFLVAVFPIVINTAAGLRLTTEEHLHLASSMGTSRWKVFLKFRFPTAYESIFSGLKVGSALSVVGALSGEFVAANRGLGYILLLSSATLDSTLVFSAVFMLAFIGIALYGAVESLEWIFSPRLLNQRRSRRSTQVRASH